jgi:PAS domain S-box-containing protein
LVALAAAACYLAVATLAMAGADYLLWRLFRLEPAAFTGHEFFFILTTALFFFLLVFLLVRHLRDVHQVTVVSDARFRSLFDQLGSAAVIYHPLPECRDFRIVAFNARAGEIEGLPASGVVGRLVTEVFPGVRAFGLFAVLQEVCRSGEARRHPISQYQDGRLQGYRENHVFRLPSGDVVAIYDDATEKMATLQALEQSRSDLEIDKRISRVFLTVPDELVYEAVLTEIRDILASPFGFLGYIDHAGSLVCPTMTSDIWAERCRMAEQTIVFPREKWAGLWGRALVLKKSMWSNGPLAMPGGHLPLAAALAVPILLNNRLVGEVCLANREGGYGDREARVLERICTFLAPLLEARLAAEQSARQQAATLEKVTRAKARLKEAEELAVMGSWHFDVASGMTRWSDGLYGLLGLAVGEVEATYQNFVDRVHPADRCVAEEGYQEALAGRHDGDFIFRLLSRDGSGKVVNARFRSVKDDDGRPVTLFSTIIDITQRVAVEDEMRQEKLFSDTIINSLPGLFYVYDEHFRLIRWNSMHEKRLGYAGKELLYKPGLDLVGPVHRKEVQEAVQRLLLGEEMYKEIELVAKDGVVAPFLCTGALVEVKGKKYMLGMAMDVSDRKRLEKELRQAQKMEAIGTLAGGIAHDFNNILAAILGYGEMALEEVPPGSLARHDLEQVMDAGRRASALVQQILAFSRQGEVEFIPVQIQHVIKEALRLLRASLPASIEIKTAIDNQCPVVNADPTQIHQVLMNLCTNAKQAMGHGGGVLTVSLGQVTLPLAQGPELGLEPGPYLELLVSDTGSGMDEAVKARIFDPFFSTKPPGQGTGLGLSVVHGIVKGHGGLIMVESGPGQGAVFRIYLPVSRREPAFEPPAPAVLSRGTERIMVVDDEELLAEIIQRSLAKLGYQVTKFTDSCAALAAWRRQSEAYDLIITDMTMPQMSGADLARQILAERPQTPLIICTGFSEVIDEAQAKALGVREFILKPVVSDELARVVRKVLDHG